MRHTPETLDYLQFMEWFQNKYPDLYVSHWRAILIPVDSKELKVNKDNLDGSTYKAITGITREYYQSKHKEPLFSQNK